MAFEKTVAAPSGRVRLVVASSVMLSFISFWRAAAIVLNDLGSSAFYAGGISEQLVGKSAPWFILGVMLFSFAVRAVYVESCSMFTRGGVGRPIHLRPARRVIGSCGAAQLVARRDGWSSPSRAPVADGLHCRCPRSLRHPLLLVAEHQRHPRVQRQSP